jgi:hypothetical protein
MVKIFRWAELARNTANPVHSPLASEREKKNQFLAAGLEENLYLIAVIAGGGGGNREGYWPLAHRQRYILYIFYQ